MNHLNFYFNWNHKLRCDFFTDIRLNDKFEIGERLRVTFKDKLVCMGLVVTKKELYLKDISPFHAGLDAGCTVDELKEVFNHMYKGVDWHQRPLTLYLIQRQIATQQELQWSSN